MSKPPVQLSKKHLPFKNGGWHPPSYHLVQTGQVDSLEAVPTATAKKISLSSKAVGKDKTLAHPSPHTHAALQQQADTISGASLLPSLLPHGSLPESLY